MKVKVKALSHVRLFVTLWTVAHQASPPSTGFSRQECWSGLPFSSPGDLPDPGIKLRSPTLQADSLPSEPPGKPHHGIISVITSWAPLDFPCCSVAKLCSILCNPMNCSTPGFPVFPYLALLGPWCLQARCLPRREALSTLTQGLWARNGLKHFFSSTDTFKYLGL